MLIKIRPLIVTLLSLACLGEGQAQVSAQSTSSPAQLSRHQLHLLLKTAHSSAQYGQLASYYRAKEADYRAKAAEEKAEWDRRAQVNASLYQKFPRPVDSAQHLYQSYVADADQAAATAKHYEQLAAQNPAS
jgi:hypothetical protein